MDSSIEKNTLMDDLRTLLLEGKVTRQEDLCSVLSAKGHNVNQSKISRLIRKLNAIKSKNELGHIVYHLPKDPSPPTISSQLSNLIIDLTANETMVIVNTSPGSAQLIARMIDFHKNNLQVIGTIAGDDSIFVAPTSVKSIDETKKALCDYLLAN